MRKRVSGGDEASQIRDEIQRSAKEDQQHQLQRITGQFQVAISVQGSLALKADIQTHTKADEKVMPSLCMCVIFL